VEGRQWTFSMSKECGSMCWLNSVTVYLFYRCHRIRTLKCARTKKERVNSVVHCIKRKSHTEQESIWLEAAPASKIIH